MNELESQLAKWQRLLLVYAGAAGILLVTTLAELSLYLESYRRMGRVMNVNPWFGICFVLLLACLTPGILLLVGRAWRTLPLARRLPPAFGFLGCAWAALAAFDLRLLPLALPLFTHFFIFGLGIILAASYLIFTHRQGKSEELFP
jgi:hypothetical protein